MNEHELLEKFANGTITPEEAKAFRENRKGWTPEELEALEARYEAIWKEQPDYGAVKDQNYVVMEARIRAWEQATPAPTAHRVHFLRTAWFRYAAVLLVIAGTATYLYHRNEGPQKDIVQQPTTNKPADIQPGGNKATLTLSDGSVIVLDSAANGSLASQGKTTIIKLDAGKLAYNGANASIHPGVLQGDVLYNTISTPKGGQYQVILQDGTKVWLNAASSIQFPTAFTRHDRSVEITGEAYFEIKADATRPFHVRAGDNRDITVLGTAFNVNAYKEEPFMKTTLLEGSIKVNFHHQSKILLPGQQAAVNNTGNASILNITKPTDLQQVLAWKNGAFDFEGAKLPEVMRQIERWYDVTVKYEGDMPQIEFGGKMRRSTPLSGIISAFARMGIHCRLEGRSLIVTP